MQVKAFGFGLPAWITAAALTEAGVASTGAATTVAGAAAGVGGLTAAMGTPAGGLATRKAAIQAPVAS